MPTADFFTRPRSLAEIEEYLTRCRVALRDAKAGPDANSYVERHRIASIQEDIQILEGRAESLRSAHDLVPDTAA
jgi:hypothetical protein